jgi:hypothetical protein
METRRKIKSLYNVFLTCDCGSDKVKLDENVVLTTYPSQYIYVCGDCGKVFTTFKLYPYFEFEYEEEKENESTEETD